MTKWCLKQKKKIRQLGSLWHNIKELMGKLDTDIEKQTKLKDI